eukprot:TRINITY_DN2555_c0_g2_i1.p1 TRINITY_DN2555_c0_g2~~TRINITY_DN2555_c0_g2_i1.p1  ORF type:complete len:312 (+),score=50.64 TRINITY_DN2555_c0_g2_i1:47-937(+)
MLSGLQCSAVMECFEAGINEILQEEGIDKEAVMRVLRMINNENIDELAKKVEALPNTGYQNVLCGMYGLRHSCQVTVKNGKLTVEKGTAPFNLADLNKDFTQDELSDYCESLLSVIQSTVSESAVLASRSQPQPSLNPAQYMVHEAIDGVVSVFSTAARCVAHPLETLQSCKTAVCNPLKTTMGVVSHCNSRPVMAAASAAVVSYSLYQTVSSVMPALSVRKESNRTVPHISVAEAEPVLHPDHVAFIENPSEVLPGYCAAPASMPSSRNDLICTTGAAAVEKAIITAIVRRALKC